MNKISEERGISFYSKKSLIIAGVATFFIGIFFIQQGLSNHSDWGERGTYGDFLGGTAGIFLEILTILVLLFIQIETNENNRAILKVTNRQGDLQFLSFYLQEIKTLSEKGFPELKQQGEDPLSELEWIYYSLLDSPGNSPNGERLCSLLSDSGALGKAFAKNCPKRMSIKSLLTALGDLISWDRNSERSRFQGLYHSSYGSTIEAVVPQESIFMLIFLWYLSLPRLTNEEEDNNIWRTLQRKYTGKEECYLLDIKTSTNIITKISSGKKTDLKLLLTEKKDPIHSLEELAIFRGDYLDKLSETIHIDSLEHTLQGNIYECARIFSQCILQLFALTSRIGFFQSIEEYCYKNEIDLQDEHLQYFFSGFWGRLSKLVTFDETIAITENTESPLERILISSFAPLIRESLFPIRTGCVKLLHSPAHPDKAFYQPNGTIDPARQTRSYRLKESYLERRHAYLQNTILMLSDLISSLNIDDYEFFHSATADSFTPDPPQTSNKNSNFMDKKSSDKYQNYLQNNLFSSFHKEITEEISPLLKKLQKRHRFLKENSLYPYNKT